MSIKCVKGGPCGGRQPVLAPGERVIAGAFSRDDRSEVRVAIDLDKHGDAVIDVRVWEEFAGPAKARTATKTGISIPLRRYHDLIHALTKLAVIAGELGLDLRETP
jgi:hypothetical protein